MVKIDVTELVSNCYEWVNELRNLRDTLNAINNELQSIVQALSKDKFLQLECLYNQIHIQLVNVQNLKHAVKAHERMLQFEKAAFNALVNEDSHTRHLNLLDRYIDIQTRVAQLNIDFRKFLP